MFELDPVLAGDTLMVGDLPLCRVLLMNDSQYPWIILVPRQADLVELSDLSESDYQQYCEESRFVATELMTLYAGHKMNIAALGNVVAQLHIHHVVRFKDDPAWPAPIWGKLPTVPYSQEQTDIQLAQLRQALIKENH